MPITTGSFPILAVASVRKCGYELDEATRVLMGTTKPSEKAEQAMCKLSPDNFACNNCGYEGLDKMDGYFFCVECGHTKGTILDGSGEWRSFPNMRGGNDDSRCGMPTNPLLPKTSLTTMIIGGGNTYLKKLHRWSSSNHREATKHQIFVAIQEVASRHGANRAAIQQAHRYIADICDRMLANDTVLRGSRRQGVIAACLYFSFKKQGSPRSVGEVASMFELDAATVSMGIKSFGDMLVENTIVSGDYETQAAVLLPRFCARIGMPDNVTALVMRVLRKANKNTVLRGHIPEAQCAACLWFVSKTCKLGRAFTKKRIGEICDVSDVTVAKCCKKLEHELLPNKNTVAA